MDGKLTAPVTRATTPAPTPSGYDTEADNRNKPQLDSISKDLEQGMIILWVDVAAIEWGFEEIEGPGDVT